MQGRRGAWLARKQDDETCLQIFLIYEINGYDRARVECFYDNVSALIFYQ